MKILIINPPAHKKKDYIREGRCMQTQSSWASLWMPLSLTYIAAVLKKDNHQVDLIDCIAEKIDKDDLIKLIKDFSPKVIVLNTAFPSIQGDKNTAQKIKKNFPNVKIVIIGLYPTLLEERSFNVFKEIDFALVGEPEWAIKHLVKAIDRKESFSKIRGLIFSDNNEIIVNIPQDLSCNKLDELPFPERSLINNDAYLLPNSGDRFTLINIGRGCHFNCTFCTANIYYGKKFRKRRFESVVDEIEECINKYKIKNFLFWGESFSINKQYAFDICEEILKRNLKIQWSTTSRVDTISLDLLKKMKQAGCILLGLGIESTNQNILNLSKKGINLSKINKAISMTQQVNIKSMGHFIFGLPGETKETAQETITFAVKSGIDYAQFYCAVPYPKTELGKIAKENNWLVSEDYSNFELTTSIMKNDFLTPEQTIIFRDKAYRKFYFRPKMFFQVMNEINSIKSFFRIFNFIGWIKPFRLLIKK